MDKQQTENALRDNCFFQNWISAQQRWILRQLLDGEEGAHFVKVLSELRSRIEAMPKTYETSHLATDELTVALHYFAGHIDSYIIERDAGDAPGGDGLGKQIQAFGRQSLFGEGWKGGEWGYINIDGLLAFNAEIDLYFTPRKVGEIQ